MRDSLGAPIEFDKAYSGYRYDCTAHASFELPGMWFTMSEVEALLQLDAAEVVGPKKLREEIKTIIDKVQKKYQKSATRVRCSTSACHA